MRETNHIVPLSTAAAMDEVLVLCAADDLEAVCRAHNPRGGSEAFPDQPGRCSDGPGRISSPDRSLGITTPMLSDIGAKVSTAYGVMQWTMPSGEPGHTFVLIDDPRTLLCDATARRRNFQG